MTLGNIFKKGGQPDYVILATVALLTVGGLVILASASSDAGSLKFGDSYYYLKHQILSGLIAGLIGFMITSRLHYGIYRKTALIFLGINLIFLVLIFTGFGVRAGGAMRWLQLGPVSFQPAELLKLSFVIYIAAWLSNVRSLRTQTVLSGLLPFALVSGGIAALLLAQPATSTVVILLGSALTVYFMSGAKIRFVGAIILLGIVAIGTLVYFTPYRAKRVLTYFNPEQDASGSSYHANQALIALGSGGITGTGYGEASAKQGYLPAVIDDSIFAIIGQEFGFIGAGLVAMLFAVLVLRMFYLAYISRDRFGKLLLIGFGSVIALQSIVHMGAMSGMLPLTGVPLPFISYGGTALAVFLTMSGIAVNVSRHA